MTSNNNNENELAKALRDVSAAFYAEKQKSASLERKVQRQKEQINQLTSKLAKILNKIPGYPTNEDINKERNTYRSMLSPFLSLPPIIQDKIDNHVGYVGLSNFVHACRGLGASQTISSGTNIADIISYFLVEGMKLNGKDLMTPGIITDEGTTYEDLDLW